MAEKIECSPIGPVVALVVAVMFSVCFVTWVVGISYGVSIMERKAVRAGYAEFIVDEHNSTLFQWKQTAQAEK